MWIVNVWRRVNFPEFKISQLREVYLKEIYFVGYVSCWASSLAFLCHSHSHQETFCYPTQQYQVSFCFQISFASHFFLGTFESEFPSWCFHYNLSVSIDSISIRANKNKQYTSWEVFCPLEFSLWCTLVLHKWAKIVFLRNSFVLFVPFADQQKCDTINLLKWVIHVATIIIILWRHWSKEGAINQHSSHRNT